MIIGMFKRKIGYFIIFTLLLGISLHWFLTVFDKELISVSGLVSDQEVSKIYLGYNEDTNDDFEIPLYDYSFNKYELLGKLKKTWVLNTVQKGGVPFVKKNGSLYLIANKGKNFSAGIVWDMKGSGLENNGKRLRYTLISPNKYIWKLDLQARGAE